MDKKIPVIAVVGPTASGKTALGVKIALAVSGEVVSADSMQIYKGMEIASAAPTKEEMQAVPHHLIGFAERTDKFSVAEYIRLAKAAINDIYNRGKTPIIVGGTGLYIDSLLEGIEFPEESDPSIRERLTAEADEKGMEHIFELLKSIDPNTAAKLHINDKKRIIRALEVFYIHNKTLTELNEESKKNGSPYEVTWIGIDFKNRKNLYKRIEQRVDIMLENGILDEARKAFNEGGGATAVQAIGHKEFFDYFGGTATLEESIERLKTETRHYAKRQLTWFRRNGKINTIYADETEDLAAKALEIINAKN